MDGGPVTPFAFPTLAGGWDPAAAPRALGPGNPQGNLWADLHNFRVHEGRLRRRAALNQLNAGPSGASTYPTVHYNDNVSGFANSQIPLIITTHSSDLSDNLAIVVVTTKEVFLLKLGVWYNLTPVYETGAVNITTGTTLVTAASGSPNWSVNGVIPGNLVELPKGSGNWYRIQAQTNTTLTLRETYTGSTLSSAAYSVRRTIDCGTTNLITVRHVFGQVFNNDLYLAGPAPNSGVWILKADDIFGIPGPPSCSILACSYAIQSGVDVLSSVGNNPVCTGLTVLDDGRIVVSMYDRATYRSRVYYSSHLNPAVWSSSPGGFTDVTAVPGTLRALGRLGSNVTLHYDTGIALGVPTGQDDPPLAYRPTTATSGCSSPRTLKAFEGGEIFVNRDWNTYFFDGTAIRPVGGPMRFHLRDRRRGRVKGAFAAIDPYRREYHVYVPQNSASATTDETKFEVDQVNETLRLVYHFDSQAWRKERFGLLIGAASDGMDGEPISSFYRTEGGRYRGTCLVGLPSYDPKFGGATTGLQTTNMLFKLSESSGSDYSPGFTTSGSMGGIYADTGDFDCGMPGTDKTISHVTVWFYSETAKSEFFSVGLSADSGTTWTYSQVNLSLVAGTEMFAHFYFEPQTSEKWRLRLKCPDGAEDGMSACPSMMVFWFVPQTPIEAVGR